MAHPLPSSFVGDTIHALAVNSLMESFISFTVTLLVKQSHSTDITALLVEFDLNQWARDLGSVARVAFHRYIVFKHEGNGCAGDYNIKRRFAEAVDCLLRFFLLFVLGIGLVFRI